MRDKHAELQCQWLNTEVSRSQTKIYSYIEVWVIASRSCRRKLTCSSFKDWLVSCLCPDVGQVEEVPRYELRQIDSLEPLIVSDCSILWLIVYCYVRGKFSDVLFCLYRVGCGRNCVSRCCIWSKLILQMFTVVTSSKMTNT